MRNTKARKSWSIDVDVEETVDRTDATATVVLDGTRVNASGHARKDPSDVAVPLIGEELAIGRALSALGDELSHRAEEAIEEVEAHPRLLWLGT